MPVPDSLTLTIDRSGRASQQVYAALRAAIVSAELEPGLPVSEKELALRLGVSRTPVREALIRLSEEDLVRIYPQLGSVIAPIRYLKVYQSLVIRSALECRSIRYTIPMVTPDGVARLRLIIAEQKRMVRAHDDESFLRADDAFHRTMVEIAENYELWKVIDSTKAHHDRVRHLSTQLRRHNLSRVQEHELVLDAVTERDTDEARRLMEAHLDPDRLVELWPQLVAQHKSYFEHD